MAINCLVHQGLLEDIKRMIIICHRDMSYLFVSSHLPSLGRWPKAEGIGVAGRTTQVVSLSLLEKGKMGPGVRGDNPEPTESRNMRLQNRNCVLPKFEEVFTI